LSSEAIVKSSTGVQQLDTSEAATSAGYLIHGTKVSFVGVLTVVAMDEWGDVVVTHLVASSH